MMVLAQERPQKRAHAIAHVGKKEIQPVERPDACLRWPPASAFWLCQLAFGHGHY
jgi:hypothetical protein